MTTPKRGLLRQAYQPPDTFHNSNHERRRDCQQDTDEQRHKQKAKQHAPPIEIRHLLQRMSAVVDDIQRVRHHAVHRLYDCRHTFTSQAAESGVEKAWLDYVTNHVSAQNVTDRVYTHWSDAFSILQMEKIQF